MSTEGHRAHTRFRVDWHRLLLHLCGNLEGDSREEAEFLIAPLLEGVDLVGLHAYTPVSTPNHTIASKLNTLRHCGDGWREGGQNEQAD